MPQGNCFKRHFLHIFPSIQWWPKHMDAAKAYRNRAKIGRLMAKVMSNAARGSASSFFTLAFLDTGFNAFLSGRVWDDTKPWAPVAQHTWTCQDTSVFHIVSIFWGILEISLYDVVGSAAPPNNPVASMCTWRFCCAHYAITIFNGLIMTQTEDTGFGQGATAEMPVKMINLE